MAWRTPTERDLAAKLSASEMKRFSEQPDFATGANPVEDVIKQVASEVRMYCRRNKQVRMAPGVFDVPESLVSTAMDLAAFNLLKRLPKVEASNGEWRKAAYDRAMETLDKVAKNELTPESFDEEDDQNNMAGPRFAEQRHKILDSRL